MHVFKNKIIFSGVLCIIALLMFSSGCKNDTSIAPVNDNVSVGYFTQNTQRDNSIVLDEAKFIVRKIVLESDGDHGEEFEVKIGPFVVLFDISQVTVVSAAVATIPAGNFHEIKFQIHKLNPNESVGDPEFFESTSQRFSVIAKGFYNGERFIYKSAITVEREIELEPQPFVVTNETAINITISLDIYSWFLQDGVVLNPMDPANKNIIDHNIKDSFKRAFRDINHDGEPD